MRPSSRTVCIHIETDVARLATPPGTSSIVDETTHDPLLSTLTLIVETAARLRKDGHRVIIVSSGAIGVGLRRMDVEKRPKKSLAKLQVSTQRGGGADQVLAMGRGLTADRPSRRWDSVA
jgi:glutamate 5-kinase